MLTRENKIEVIGKLVEINLTKAFRQDLGDYIYGDLVVEVKKPKTMRIPISFFAKALKKDSTDANKVYGSILQLSNGQRVNIVGNVSDNKFWNQTTGQLVKGKRLNLNFINPAKEGDVDKAQFTFSGFVAESLKEKFDNDQKLIAYTVKMGQSNYQQTRAEVITFNLDVNNTKAVRYVESEFTKNKTFKVTGELDYNVETVEKVEEVDFGDPIVRTYQRNISNLIITGGVAVDIDTYSAEDVTRLLEADANDDKDVQEKAKNKEKAGETVSTNKPAATKGVAESLL